MIFTDIEFTDDIQFSGGDFNIINSEQQHIEHILIANKGSFRQWPLIGVNVLKMLNGPINSEKIKQDMIINLMADNFRVDKISVTSDYQITIDAKKLK